MKVIQILDKLGEVLVIKKWKPIGTILMFDREQDMSKLYYGTWQLTLTERSPIGVNPSASENRFKTAGQQFGEKTHTLTVDEMPSHRHKVTNTTLSAGSPGYFAKISTSDWGPIETATSYTGGGQEHNNIHPVETVYFYKRTA